MTLHSELTKKKGGRHKKLRDARELEHLQTYLDKFAAQPRRASKSNDARLDAAIEKQAQRMLSIRDKGEVYWNAELDSNAGLGAEYIMMLHFLGIASQPEWAERQRQIANFTRGWQNADGSWSIYAQGPGHLSYTVTCYFGLKLAGDLPDAPHMAKAREWILAHGGAMPIGVEQRLLLALFGQYDWAGVPPIPSWMVLLPNMNALPRLFDAKLLSIYDLSYWCRISLVPMSILYQLKPLVKLDPKYHIDELFLQPKSERKWSFAPVNEPGLMSWGGLFSMGAKAVKALEFATSPVLSRVALNRAQKWILDHQDDSGDWGGIYPPVMYNIMALHRMGMPLSDERIVKAFKALDRFMIAHGDGLHVLACVSPVWDTAWAMYALAEAGFDIGRSEYQRGTDWLYAHQILRDGDWAVKNPSAIPGGWCFQFYNDFYPDLDDTAVVLQALLFGGYKKGDTGRLEQTRIGLEWVLSMQNTDGGWSAFECGVDKDLVNHIPFNDLSNMLDPSTADVTGHVLEMLGHFGFDLSFKPAARAAEYLRKTQEREGKRAGSWWGRWGVNYIYGTWSALAGLMQVGEDMSKPYARKAVAWLYGVQNADGGWGEGCETYQKPELAGTEAHGASTPSQTAWAILGLLAAGELDDARLKRGIEWLLSRQNREGGWNEDLYTGTGFPNAFYLNYHFYREYFPLLALGRYRNALCGLRAI